MAAPAPTACRNCGQPMAQRPTGRPRLYCSMLCRASAFHRRHILNGHIHEGKWEDGDDRIVCAICGKHLSFVTFR